VSFARNRPTPCRKATDLHSQVEAVVANRNQPSQEQSCETAAAAAAAAIHMKNARAQQHQDEALWWWANLLLTFLESVSLVFFCDLAGRTLLSASGLSSNWLFTVREGLPFARTFLNFSSRVAGSFAEFVSPTKQTNKQTNPPPNTCSIHHQPETVRPLMSHPEDAVATFGM
jgi:hypothetical protein